MKRMLLTICALACAAAVPVHGGDVTEQERASVIRLWEDYGKASSADKPQSEMEILDSIIGLARESHLSWDFYEAWQKKVSAGSRRNWKDNAKLCAARDSAYDAYGEPVIEIVRGRYGFADVLAGKDRLKSVSNEGFYNCGRFWGDVRGSGVFGEALAGSLKNDYEFALWYMLGHCPDARKEEVRGIIESQSGYPQTALAAFDRVSRKADSLEYVAGRRMCYASYEKKWAGSAASMLAGEQLLSLEMDTLCSAAAGDREAFRLLRVKCAEFERKRSSLSGTDRLIAGKCILPAGLLSRLDSKDVEITVDRTSITLCLRNTDSLEISIYDSEDKDTALWSDHVTNPYRSYYVIDTLTIPVPVRNDGDYVVRASSGKVSATCRMPRHSISAAVVNDAEGWKVYAADCLSGKPMAAYDVDLYDTKEKSPKATCAGLSQSEGMTLVPDAIASAIGQGRNGSQYIVVSHTDSGGVFRSSSPLYLYRDRIAGLPVSEMLRGVIFKDCGAYHRGDVLHCKAVLFTGNYYGNMACAARNVRADLVFRDPDGNIVDRRDVKTDEYGSVAADFEIPSSIKGGLSSLELSVSGRVLSSVPVRADDFVLPAFDCVFESLDGLYAAGDSVTVRGCFKSYNGHRMLLSGASYRISGIDGESRVAMAPDGSFEIKVPVPGSRWWGTSVTVTAVSASGEVLEFSKYVPAGGSPDLRVSLENGEQSCSVEDDGKYQAADGQVRCLVLSDTVAVFRLEVFNADNVSQTAVVEYSLCRGGELLQNGEMTAPGLLEMKMPDGTGECLAVFRTSFTDGAGHKLSERVNCRLVRIVHGSDVLDADLENIFIPGDGAAREISFEMGAARGPVWAVATLYGPDRKPLYDGIINIDGVRGESGSMKTVGIPCPGDLPDAAELSLFYFRNGRIYRWSHVFRRSVPDGDMEIRLSRFADKAVPGSKCTVTLNTGRQAQVLAAVFDKSTEQVASNVWNAIPQLPPAPESPYFGFSAGGWYSAPLVKNAFTATSVRNAVTMLADGEVAPDGGYAVSEVAGEVRLRSDFSTSLFWNPFLKTSDDGTLSFDFMTSDKTGTFLVSLFAHDKAMRNAVVRKEMTVSLPLEISVAPPTVLRAGDRYVIKAVLSSSGESVTGDFSVDAGSCGGISRAVSVEADSVAVIEYPLEVPSGMDSLRVTLAFRDRRGRFSDAMAFRVPVTPAFQTLTEAHSAICPVPSDREEISERLCSLFVNTSSEGAVTEVKMLSDLVAAALKPAMMPESGNCLDVSAAVASRLLYSALTGEDADAAPMLGRLDRYRNSDGGYAWMEGMSSSPVVTATLLERVARVASFTGNRFLTGDILTGAVRYLDREIFSGKWNYGNYVSWCPGISMTQYLYVRSFYPDVAFVGKAARGQDERFRTQAAGYLFPGNIRGLQNNLFSKVLRLSILDNIYSSPYGMGLLDSLGIVPAAGVRDVLKSLRADVESLEEYAVNHPSGGMYYPNLVMPYRGLLSSEAYCHSLLCDLLGRYLPEVADGIRLWLMVQKESQEWDGGFEFTNAIASVMGGSARLKGMSVVVVSKTYSKPYSEMLATGNGMSLSRSFYLSPDGGGRRKLVPGDSLMPGDRVEAVYNIWNAENRSHVRLSVPWYGCLRPVDQLSGMMRRWAGTLDSGVWRLPPQGYREVFEGSSVYWFESFPEGNTEIREEFFVTQTGVFTAPVVEVESLYAPYYRANGPYEGPLSVE